MEGLWTYRLHTLLIARANAEVVMRIKRVKGGKEVFVFSECILEILSSHFGSVIQLY